MPHVRLRVLARLRNIDEVLAQRVADGLAIALPEKAPAAREIVEMPVSDALSIQKNAKDGFAGRKVGILFAEGSDKAMVEKIKAGVEKAGGSVFLVAPKVGALNVKGGTLEADGKLDGSPSVLFDAIASVLMPESAEKLSKQGAAVQWFMDAYGHCKTIAHCPGTQIILDKAGVEMDDGVIPNEMLLDKGPKRHWAREPKIRDLA